MNVKIYPGKAHGLVSCPPSKSLLHRAIICAALAKGKSKIYNISLSDDIMATINCLKALGAKILIENNHIVVNGIENFGEIRKILLTKESASTLRFLIPLCTLFKNKIVIEGSSDLFKRPLDVYEDIFNKQNLIFKKIGNRLLLDGNLQSGEYLLHGNISSQFVSGLLFLLPLLEAPSTIKIIPPIVSKGYIDLTVDVLKEFGITIMKRSETEFYIPALQIYKTKDYFCEGDFSQAAFFAALGTINGDVECQNIVRESLQPDKKILDILEDFHAQIIKTPSGYRFTESKMTMADIDITNCPDLGPIIACIVTKSSKPIVIKCVGRLVYKESNRLVAICDNLQKFGIETELISSDELKIYPSDIKVEEDINSYNDHRIFMAFAILATIADKPVTIKNYECINKSYPEFLRDLEKLGVRIEYLNEKGD